MSLVDNDRAASINVLMDGKFEWKAGRAHSSHMHYSIYASRFLRVFGLVRIFARAYERPDSAAKTVSGPNAQFIRMPSYKGALQFLRVLPRTLVSLFRIARESRPLVLYLPGTLPILGGIIRRFLRKPYYCLLVADPEDQLSKTALDHPLQPIARTIFANMTRSLMFNASVAMYVTESFLQKRYPIRNGQSFATSDVFIPKNYYRKPLDEASFDKSKPVLIYVAMMSQAYKGHDILFAAVSKMLPEFPGLELRLVGGGSLEVKLKALAESLGIERNVTFLGLLPSGPAVHNALDEADLFVMPSRAEGLPRALIEAMARGLPAVATDVGGISELLDQSVLVPRDNVDALSLKIVELLRRSDIMADHARRNFVTSRRFEIDRVEGIITGFYSCIEADWKRYEASRPSHN